ncbi:MAG: T9SS type A sorting domain-containing protein [Bacteroidetes bacterium]|nr:MAG: T9SS type A sorting domain-containing protein [Bacteroidota bacterium]
MKKLLLLLTIFLYASASQAQSGGPDGFGYEWRDSNHPQGPAYNWIDITTLPAAVQVTGLTDDNTSSLFSMGFQFPYYWYTITDYKVGANGYIIFNNGICNSPFPTIPAAGGPNDYIAAMASDLNFLGTGNNAECWTWSNQTDSVIISYINVPFWFNNTTTPYVGLNTFQMILTSVDSSITFQYMLQQGTSAATADFVTIGIENNTGAIGLQHSTGVYPPVNYAVKFYYPATSLLSIPDASAQYNVNETSGGIFLSKDGDPFYMNSRVKNTGNDTAAPFNVNLRILSDLGITVVQENILTDTLLPGDGQDMVATLPFNPNTAGTYTFRTTTSLSGDVTITNNERLSEVIVVDTTVVDIALSYTGNAPVPANASISWSGGNSGVGVEIVPPFYPCFIRKLEYFIVANTDNTGFYSLMYDNTGPDNGPGTLLDSTYLDGQSQVIPGIWNTVTLPTPIRVDSGSVFIEWRMEGANIALGTDNTPPIGNRSYEILGGWSVYRSRETEDPMIRAQVATTATAGITSTVTENFVGEFYPSPASSRIALDLSLENANKAVQFNVFNIQGKMVQSSSKNVNGTQRVVLDVSALSPGVYICNIIAGDSRYNRKFIIQ